MARHGHRPPTRASRRAVRRARRIRRRHTQRRWRLLVLTVAGMLGLATLSLVLTEPGTLRGFTLGVLLSIGLGTVGAVVTAGESSTPGEDPRPIRSAGPRFSHRGTGEHPPGTTAASTARSGARDPAGRP